MELLLTAEQITAQRAQEIGLAGWVVPHSALLPAARALTERLLTAAPLAVRATKEVARRAPDMSTVDAIRFGETMRLVANATQDAAEGRAAALERRPPVWRGR
jgi:E-phenylitaconyl-CoA hydratase